MSETQGRGHLDKNLQMGAVELRVSDLSRALAFYQDDLGFEVVDQQNGGAALGSGEAPANVIVRLREHSGAGPKPRNSTGLYHYAVLLPERRHLARVLAHMLERETPLQGASDHLVSEALYLADPDGNGIEIYRDRPRSEWSFRDNELSMATLPLDLEDLLTEAGGDRGQFEIPGGSRIGHVHLHVADLEQAERFYSDLVGFEVMTRYGSQASFLSEGGYHHHLGINTWAGRGAPPPPPDAAGLIRFNVQLSSQGAVHALAERLENGGVEFDHGDGSLVVDDPSGNRSRFYVGAG